MDCLGLAAEGPDARPFNGPYRGATLSRVAFPIGGIGAGMFCLEGSGAISHVSLRHRMEFFHEPTVFAAVHVAGDEGREPVSKVLEGPIPEWKYFGRAGTGNGGTGTTYGLPRFHEAEMLARFPFAEITLRDAAVPLQVSITGWSPFTPPDADPSSAPVGALEYRFENLTQRPLNAVFSWNARNFLGNGSIGPIAGGFVLDAASGDERDRQTALAVFVPQEQVTVDHCWFRGGWWDPLTIAWHNVSQGKPVDNPPVEANAPGASLAVPLTLAPGQQ